MFFIFFAIFLQYLAIHSVQLDIIALTVHVSTIKKVIR